MTPRDIAGRPAEPLSLPIFARLAPALPADVLAARIEATTALDDVVIDLFGRGGWVARAALALGRRAVSVETSPLTRLLADVVVRAPDLRHLDAAFQAVAAAPLGTTSLRAWIDEGFATRCPTCGRTLALEELVWEPGPGQALRPTRRSFRCPACLDRRGRGGELRQVAPRRGISTWRRPPPGIPSCARRSPAASRWATSRAASWSSCWSSTRRASLPPCTPSSPGSRASSARRRSRPPCAWPSCTPSCRPAASTGIPAGPAPCASPRVASGPPERRAGANATRGAPSRRATSSSGPSCRRSTRVPTAPWRPVSRIPWTACSTDPR